MMLFQVPIISWFDDPNDRELLELIPFFENLAKIDDVYTFLSNANLPSSGVPTYVMVTDDGAEAEPMPPSIMSPSVTSPLVQVAASS